MSGHSGEEPSPFDGTKFTPYVAPETQMTESTVGAIVIGSILGIVFAAASVYAGLKVGLTTSASIPIAVLAITLFRAFGKSTILKNNIVQTTGSAGESLAAGVAFTLPSLLLMGFDIDVLRTTLVALLGGALGVLMMIPLRHGLMVKEHGRLPYPEGTACAQVLIVGDKGGASAKSLFGGLFLGGAFALLGRIGKLFGEYATWPHRALDYFKGGSISFETNPVLLGTGFIIGWRTSFIMLAGGMLSFLVLIPAIKFFGPEMTSPLVGAGAISAADMSPNQLRNAFVLYIGAGAVATGGLISLARSLPTILGAFTRSLGSMRGTTAGGEVPRTERDLPMSVVVFGSIALVAVIAGTSLLEPVLGRDVLGVNWLSAILLVVFGFFFVTVSSRITGEIGSSSNPISGMTVATLLITCLLFVAAKWTGISYKEMALCTAALVCVAASNGGTCSQDLKTGFLVGATPKKQQIAIMWGVVTSSLFIGWTLVFLNEKATTYVERTYPSFSVTAERLAAAGDALHVADDKREFRAVEYDVLYIRKDVLEETAPAEEQKEKKILVPRGKYLVKDGAIAWYVDPGVCGTEPEQIGPDGKVEREVSKFDAPKAQLFRLIIDGVLGGDLPWALVLIGVFLAIMMELCGVPALPFAVGAYLPIATSASIFVGGLMRKWADRRSGRTPAEQESSPGVLFSSGLIAGGAIAGILIAAITGSGVSVTRPDGVVAEVPLIEHWNLELSHRFLGEEETLGQAFDRVGLSSVGGAFGEGFRATNARAFLDENRWWAFAWYAMLALVLYLVAARKPKRLPPPPAESVPSDPLKRSSP